MYHRLDTSRSLFAAAVATTAMSSALLVPSDHGFTAQHNGTSVSTRLGGRSSGSRAPGGALAPSFRNRTSYSWATRTIMRRIEFTGAAGKRDRGLVIDKMDDDAKAVVADTFVSGASGKLATLAIAPRASRGWLCRLRYR